MLGHNWDRFFVVSSLLINLHVSIFLLSDVICIFPFSFSSVSVLWHFPLLLIMQPESVCSSHCHVYTSFCFTALMHHWLAAHQLTFTAPGSNTRACFNGRAKAHWYRHFRATSAYSSCRMGRKHCEPFMFCFPLHLLLKSAWSAAYTFVALVSVSHSARTSFSFSCDNRTRTWLIRDKTNEDCESYGPENEDSKGSSIEKSRGKPPYHFQSAAGSAWLMLKWHISLSDRACSHSCYFFHQRWQPPAHTHTYTHAHICTLAHYYLAGWHHFAL